MPGIGKSFFLLAALLCQSSVVLASTITVVGIMSGRAMIQVDGSSRLYSVGQTIGGTQKLAEVGDNYVMLESQGKKQRVNIGQRAMGAASGVETAFLHADARGHYQANGTINDSPVHFLVDTGASAVAMGVGQARRLGLDKLAGNRRQVGTANGVVMVTCVTLERISLGDINLTGVEGCYSDKDMPFVLLGMSFLGRTEMKTEGSQLQLKKRY